MFKYIVTICLVSLTSQGYTESEQASAASNLVTPVVDTSISDSGQNIQLVPVNNSGEMQKTIDSLNQVRVTSNDEDIEDEIDDIIDSLEDKIEALSDQIDELRESKEKTDSQDTVDAQMIIGKIQEHRRIFTESVSKARAQGYGGGAIIQPMLLAMKMKPVNRLIQENSSLNSFRFSDIDNGYNLMLVSGGFGFGGLGNGLRIGFGGWGGEINYDGERASGAADSVMTLKVSTGYGGMLVEKAYVHKNINFINGGMIGWGNLTVNRKVKSATAFKSSWVEFSDEDLDQAKATYTGLELHSGFTVTMLPWLHLGMDLNGMVLISVNGFSGSGGSGFTMFNPGMRLRIVLGNLG